MTTPQATLPMPLSPVPKSDEKADERADCALADLMKEDQWVNDFIRRLNYAIEDIVRKK
jgi:hypothetical protein